MILKILFTIIPKSVNEFIFVLAAIGIVLLIQRKEKRLYSCLLMLTTLMIAWRLVFRIDSSRYALILIYPLTFLAAYVLGDLLKSGKKYSKLILLGLLAVMLFFWSKKNYDVTQINTNLNVIAEVHEQYNRTNKDHALVMHFGDAGRVLYHEKIKGPCILYSDSQSVSNLSSFLNNFRIVNYNVLYDMIVNAKDACKIKVTQKRVRYKQILSIFCQKNKKKKHCLFLVETPADCRPVSRKDIIYDENNILDNGNFEDVDSPERSYSKFKAHIDNYSVYYEYNPLIRTPRNVYFDNAANTTQSRPYYNCSNDNPIAGQHSVCITNTTSSGSMILFEQKIPAGEYEYSALVRGEKNTKINLLYYANVEKKWYLNTLATFIVPDKRLYLIKTSFVVDTPAKDDYLRVGASMTRGTAYFDNFMLYSVND